MQTVDGGDEAPRGRLAALSLGTSVGLLLAVSAVLGALAAVLLTLLQAPAAAVLGSAAIGAVGAVGTVAWRWSDRHQWRSARAELDVLRDQEQRFRMLVQNSYDVVTVNDVDGTITYMSGGSQRMFGRKPGERRGANILELVHPQDKERVTEIFRQVTVTAGSSQLFQMRFPHSDGSWRWVEVLISNLLDEPSVRGVVCNSRDITEMKALQEKLAYDAHHDALTGMANRALLHQRLAGHLDERVTVVLVDLDDFKIVNDSLGHAVGDALLVTVADRMRRAVRDEDTVARLGGDEFALLLTADDTVPTELVLSRIIESLSEPISVDGNILTVKASFGIAEAGTDDTAGDLMRRADIAMYKAKEQGDGRWRYFEPGMTVRGGDTCALAAELRHAIDSGELRVHYQPMVSLPSGELTGVEALVRWQHPDRGLLGPDDFIPVAESSGLIVPLGDWVLREACRQAASWHREHGDRAPGSLSVNISARQLLLPSCADEVEAALRDTGLPAGRLVLEITESTAVGGGATSSNLRRIRELGVRVALDDFGTGHSTLSLLASTSFDQIKLDRSFTPGPGADVMATAVMQIARLLGLDAVAEGVETPAQADRLHALGYEHAQGFHFARPMPAAAVTALLSTPSLLADVR
jgi:diguanylate cyclase (GGDEF)-like protein/PAS domain S-box-containing protein